MNDKNTIELTLEQAKEIHSGIMNVNPEFFNELKSHLEDKFPELRPKKITDTIKTVEDVRQHFNNTNADCFYTHSSGAIREVKNFSWDEDDISNSTTTEENQKSAIAFIRLLNLAWVLNEGYEECQIKWIVDANQKSEIYVFDTDYPNPSPIWFKSKTLAEHALQHNQQLFKDLFKVR